MSVRLALLGDHRSTGMYTVSRTRHANEPPIFFFLCSSAFLSFLRLYGQPFASSFVLSGVWTCVAVSSFALLRSPSCKTRSPGYNTLAVIFARGEIRGKIKGTKREGNETRRYTWRQKNVAYERQQTECFYDTIRVRLTGKLFD